MSAVGFLICCMGSGVFGWLLHRTSDRSMIVRRDEIDYRRQHCDDVIMQTLREARAEATGRRNPPGLSEPPAVIDLRDHR